MSLDQIHLKSVSGGTALQLGVQYPSFPPALKHCSREGSFSAPAAPPHHSTGFAAPRGSPVSSQRKCTRLFPSHNLPHLAHRLSVPSRTRTTFSYRFP